MTDGQFIATLVLVIVAIAGLSAIIKEKPDPDSHLPDAEPLDWNGTIRRKRDAKRFNEHLKLLSAFLNTMGAAFIVTGVLAPFAGGNGNSIVWVVIAVMFAFVLHVAGHIVLRFWQSEE